MSRKLKIIAVCISASLVLALMVYLANRTPFAEQRPAVGARAPELDLADVTGSMISLRDHEGEVVLVNFWADWCPPCKAELEWFERIYSDLRESGFLIVAISIDDLPLERLMEMGVSYPVAVANERVREAYGGAGGVPESFLIGRDGVIIRKVGRAWPEDDLRAEIIKALSESEPQPAK